jgi:hypothetical protein
LYQARFLGRIGSKDSLASKAHLAQVGNNSRTEDRRLKDTTLRTVVVINGAHTSNMARHLAKEDTVERNMRLPSSRPILPLIYASSNSNNGSNLSSHLCPSIRFRTVRHPCHLKAINYRSNENNLHKHPPPPRPSN